MLISSRPHGLFSPTLVLIGFAALAVTPAHAQNLVQDGDFEQASTSQTFYSKSTPFDTHWSIPQGLVGIASPSNDSFYVLDGSNSLYLTAANSGTSMISQTLTTTQGEDYVLSFTAADIFGGNNLLAVNFGSAVVSGGAISVPDDGSTMTYQYNVQTTSPTTALTFAAVSDGTNSIVLDDISVTAAPVPEASTTISFSLLLLGLGGLAAAARRKRHSSTL